MQIDEEIQNVEHQLAQRRLKVELLARATMRRTVGTLVSPAGIATAAGLGFLAVAGVMRRPRYVERRNGKRGIVGGLIGLGATLGVQLLRAQLSSPARLQRLAAVVGAFFKRKSSSGDIRQAQVRARSGG